MNDIEVVSNYREFQNLKSLWNDLCESDPDNDMVFLTHEWFNCWLNCFLKNSRLLILLVKRKNETIGIAPLIIRNVFFRGIPIRLLSFIDNGNSGHNNFIIRPDVRKEAIEKIFSFLIHNVKGWDLIELKRLPPESMNYSLLYEFLKSQNFIYAEREGTEAPYLQIISDWQSLFNALSNKTKKTLRNINNRIIKRGSYCIHRITEYEDYENHKSLIYKIERNSWKKEKESYLLTSANRKFFDLLTQVAAQKHWLNIWILEVNNQPLAYEYHLTYKGRVHGLRSSYDENFKELSPGSFLDYQIMMRLYEIENLHEYDMGGNVDFYKQRWTRDSRKHQTIYIFRKNIYSKIIHFLDHRLVPVLRPLKRTMIKKKE